MNRAAQFANTVLQRRGYLVLQYSRPGPKPTPTVGEVIAEPLPATGVNEFVEGPFYVTAVTDREDFEEQQRVVGRAAPPESPGREYFYFRLVAE